MMIYNILSDEIFLGTVHDLFRIMYIPKDEDDLPAIKKRVWTPWD